MKPNLTVKKHINRHEYIIGNIYVFFMFASILGGCAYFLLKQNKDLNVFTQKIITIKKMNRIKEHQSTQANMAEFCDSLYYRIDHFNPDIQASYEENDIKFLINDVRLTYTNNSWDKRRKIFAQIANFYDNWLIDKKELWSKKENIDSFEKNLEECKIGIDKNNESLKLKLNIK